MLMFRLKENIYAELPQSLGHPLIVKDIIFAAVICLFIFIVYYFLSPEVLRKVSSS